MTTTSEQLTAAIQAMTDLTETFDAEAQAIRDSVAFALGAAPELTRRVHVDPVNGDDANTGEEATPVATLQRAVAMTPALGRGLITLHNDITLAEDVDVRDKRIEIRPLGGLAFTPKIRFDDMIDGAERSIAGFFLTIRASLWISNIDLETVADDPDIVFPSSLFEIESVFCVQADVKLVDVNVTLLTGQTVFEVAPFTLFSMSIVTVTGVAAGQFIHGQSAGASAADLNYLITNLNAL